MPTSKTEICNMALAHCGVGERINNVDTEKSVAAIQCRLFFDHCVGLMLEMQEWSFANRQVELQDLGTPRDGWAYRYAYPNFCALALFVGDATSTIPLRDQRVTFKIVDRDDASGQVILTNQPNATLEYNHRVTNVDLFTATFVESLSLLLASHIATPLRVNPDISRAAEQRFGVWANEAGMQTLRESRENPMPDSDFVTGRG